MTATEVLLKDGENRTIGPLVQQSVRLAQRHNDIGNWLVDATMEAELAEQAVGGRIAIRADDVLVMTGPIHEVSFNEKTGSATLAGPDDMIHLADRVAYPDPLREPGSWTSAEDVITAQASTAMISLVDRNLGPAARSERQLLGLTFAEDPLAGDVVTIRGRGEVVLDLLRDKAAANGLGFSMLDQQFRVFLPPDKPEVIFSPDRQTSGGAMWVDRIPDATTVIVGGDGEGLGRGFVGRTSTESTARYMRRREAWVDGRNLPTTDELRTAGDEVLAQQPVQSTVQIDGVQHRTQRWPEHFGVGDRVRAKALGTMVTQTITEIDISIGATTEIKPVIGPSEGIRLAEVLDRRAQEQRIRLLEAR